MTYNTTDLDLAERLRANNAAWAYDDQPPPREVEIDDVSLDQIRAQAQARRERSTPYRIAKQVQDERQARAQDHAQVDDQLAAQRRARIEARRRLRGISSAERLAARARPA